MPRRARKWREWWRTYRWWVVAGLALTSFVLGAVGYHRWFAMRGDRSSVPHDLYFSLQLFTINSAATGSLPWTLQVARFLSPAVAFTTAIGAVAAVLREQTERARARRSSGHVVICGLGDKGLRIATAFRREGRRVVVVELDPANGLLAECRDGGIPTVVGDARSEAALAVGRIDRASHVVVTCGRDDTNADVLLRVAAYARGRARERPTCIVHISDPSLASLLTEARAASNNGGVRVTVFNVYSEGARLWLNEHSVRGRTESGEPPHLLVVGAGRLARNLVVEAVRSWLSSTGGAPEGGARLRVTLVDADASEAREALLSGHAQMERYCDLVALDASPSTPDLLVERMRRLFSERGPATSIFVSQPDPGAGIATGLAFVRSGLAGPGVPVIVRANEMSGLAAFVAAHLESPSLNAFPLLERTCRPAVLLGETPEELVARAIHEDYVRGREGEPARAGDDRTLVGWAELPESLKESNRRQGAHVLTKLEAVGRRMVPAGAASGSDERFTSEEVELLARMEHDRWTAERLFEGWTPGERDPEAKKTPYLIPYDELPEDVKEYDRDAVRRIPELLRQAGYAIAQAGGLHSPDTVGV